MAVRKRRGAPSSTNAVDIAMEAAASGKAPDDDARSLIRKQERLIDAQLFAERIGNGLKVAAAGAAVLAAILAGVMVWNASRANGLVIEAFSVPPALAARGVTGEVIARQVMSDLARASRLSNSTEVQRNVATFRASDFSIEIPQTGISIGQLDQWLRQTLGRETRITGEVIQAADGGVTLRVRSGFQALDPILGTEATLDATIRTAAEKIFEIEQPASYGAYLWKQGRLAEAEAWARSRMLAGPAASRATAHHVLALVLETQDDAAAYAEYLRALEVHELPETLTNLGWTDSDYGHAEKAQAWFDRMRAATKRYPNYSSEVRRQRLRGNAIVVATTKGDYATSVRLTEVQGETNRAGQIESNLQVLARQRAGLHEISRAQREVRAAGEGTTAGNIMQTPPRTRMAIAMNAENWAEALEAADALSAIAAARADKGAYRPQLKVSKARALAMLGRIDEAQALIGATPLDCDFCVTARGVIANQAKGYRAADHWFSQAVKMSPSSPFPNLNWGRALLDRGEVAGASVKLIEAHKRGPKFADPLHYWGESLLLQSKTKEAVKRFRQADKHAPRWGRNHLLWGEALAKLGKGDEAKAQWKIAATLDLTPAERARLAALGAR